MGEKCSDGPGLGKIIVYGPRAVQVNIIDVARRNGGIVNGSPHCCQGALTVGVWFYRVVGVTGQAGTQQPGDGPVPVVCRQQ